MKYSIQAKADQDVADIHINDFIGDWFDGYFGFGVTAKSFLEEVQALADIVKTVRMHINTPGGDVFAANHIANMMRDQQAKGRTFEAYVTAALSAGTIITSAAKVTRIAQNGVMMIHEPWTRAVGNSRDLRKAAEISDKFRDTIVAAYRWKSKLSAKKLGEMMAEETWMDAAEAVKNGFADETIDSLPMAAYVDPQQLAILPKVPEQFREIVQALFKPADQAPAADKADDTGDDAPDPGHPKQKADPTSDNPKAAPQTEIQNPKSEAAERAESAEIVKLCNANGVPEMAAEFLAKGATLDAVQARFAHAADIRNRCAAAQMPDRAAKYIAAGLTPEEVGDHLLKLKAALDAPEIDNKLKPTTWETAKSQKRVDSVDIWNRYNKPSK